MKWPYSIYSWAILPAHGIACINQPAWATAQRALFPEAGASSAF